MRSHEQPSRITDQDESACRERLASLGAKASDLVLWLRRSDAKGTVHGWIAGGGDECVREIALDLSALRSQASAADQGQRLGLSLCKRGMLSPEQQRFLRESSWPSARRIVWIAEPVTLLDSLAIEALHLPKVDKPRELGGGPQPIVDLRCELLRLPDALPAATPPSVLGRLKVLLLLGDLKQEEGAEPRDAEGRTAFDNVLRAFAALGTAVDLRILRGTQAPCELGQATKDASALQGEIHDFAPHALLYVGHAIPASADSGERASRVLHLGFEFSFPELRQALRGTPLRLLVLYACSCGGPVARDVTDLAEHVVSIAKEIDPAHFPAATQALCTALVEGAPIGSTVQRVRAALPRSEREALQHWSTTLALHPLVDELGLLREHWRLSVQQGHQALLGELFVDLAAKNADLLHDLYVELSLESRERSARKHQVLRLPPEHARCALHELVAGTVELVDEQGRAARGPARFLLLADPGSGKTTLLRHLARRLASESGWLPIFRALLDWPRRFDGRGFLPLEPALEAIRPGLARVFRERDTCGRAPLFLDGLDELQDADDPRALRELLSSLCAELRSPIVLTSRKVGFPWQILPGPFVALETSMLSPEQKEQLVERFLEALGEATPKQTAREYLALWAGERDLAEITDTPLFLHLVAWLWHRGRKDLRRRHQVYDAVLKALSECQHRDAKGWKAEEGWKDAALRPALRGIAYELALLPEREQTLERLAAAMARWPADERKLPGLLSAREFLQVFAKRTGILRPIYDETHGERWSFLVKPLRDALIGEHLYQRFYLGHAAEEGIAAVIAELRTRLQGNLEDQLSQWGEALAVLTGWIEGDPAQPDVEARNAWIAALLDRSPELALRAVGFAGAFDRATARELMRWERPVRMQLYAALGRLQGTLQERRETILELVAALPREFDRGERAEELWHLAESLKVIELTQTERRAAERRLFEQAGHELVARDLLLRCAKEKQAEELWALIPAGYGRRGSPDGEGYDYERPAHVIHFERPFRLSRIAITQELFQLFDPAYQPRWPGENLPATNITWFEAEIWCRWAGHVLGVEGRLPTEAEWEYGARGQSLPDARAARAVTWPPYWSGQQLSPEVARYVKDMSAGPRSATEGRANPFHLRNVHGNVWEWCQDWYGRYEPAGADAVVVAPSGAARGVHRVLRGGSYWDGADGCRAAYRDGSEPQGRDLNFGFRAYLAAPPELEDRS